MKKKQPDIMYFRGARVRVKQGAPAPQTPDAVWRAARRQAEQQARDLEAKDEAVRREADAYFYDSTDAEDAT